MLTAAILIMVAAACSSDNDDNPSTVNKTWLCDAVWQSIEDNGILIVAQAENPVHMLNWAVRSVKFLGVEFDQSEDEEVSVSDAAHL